MAYWLSFYKTCGGESGSVVTLTLGFIYIYLFIHTTTSTRQSVAILVELKMGMSYGTLLWKGHEEDKDS